MRLLALCTSSRRVPGAEPAHSGGTAIPPSAKLEFKLKHDSDSELLHPTHRPREQALHQGQHSKQQHCRDGWHLPEMQPVARSKAGPESGSLVQKDGEKPPK
jgi:hypothetical protein